MKTNKCLQGSDLAYKKYVVSIKYHKLYKFDECKETIGDVSRSKHCTTSSNTIYHCIREEDVISIENLLLSISSIQLEITCIQKEFVERWELWRNRKCSENVYSDIFEGIIWTKFNNPNKNNCLTEKHIMLWP